jgi:hypothetical protein
MQTLELCGAYLGQVIGSTKANPQGQKENRYIIDHVQKPWLKKHGFDSKGQYPLPPEDFDAKDPTRRDFVERVFEEQNFPYGTRPIFKDAKACLDWVAWDYSFPNAIWVIVRRDDDGIIKSCMSPKAPFMSAFNDKKGWQWWINEHKKRLEQIKHNCKYVYEIDTDLLVTGYFDEIRQLVNDLDLEWNPIQVRKNLAKT